MFKMSPVVDPWGGGRFASVQPVLKTQSYYTCLAERESFFQKYKSHPDSTQYSTNFYFCLICQCKIPEC